jgi:dihydrofolate reductase
MIISLIAAMSENRVIGIKNKLPWHCPEDFKHFKKITTGHSVIMGRKTYESMNKLLPNRDNIIVTRNPDYKVEGAVMAYGLKQALDACSQKESPQEVFIIGGQQLFEEAMTLCHRIYLTIIHKTFEGDTYFPKVDFENTFDITDKEHIICKPPNKYEITFLKAERKKL